MNKIKIAFFADVLKEDYDGAVRTMYQILSRVDSSLFDLRIFCGVGPDKDIGLPVTTIPNFEIPFNKSYKMALPFLISRKLKHQLNAFDPDVIHIATPSALGHFALNYGKSQNVPVSTIYHTHFQSYVGYYLRHFKEFIPLMEKVVLNSLKSFYNQCERIYVPTTQMMSELKDAGVRTDNMLLWPRGIDHDTFNPLNRNLNYIKMLTGNSKPNLLFASRLVWEKNLETLIRIYNAIETKQKAYNLIVAGDGVAGKSLREAMPNAIFTGNLDHIKLAALYASADVFIFPSVSETYGNVVVEAMACGLPCVIAKGGGTQSLVTQNYNGFLVDPDNESEYLDRVEEVLQKPILKSRLIINGYKSVKNLSWVNLVNKLFADWKKLKSQRQYGIAS